MAAALPAPARSTSGGTAAEDAGWSDADDAPDGPVIEAIGLTKRYGKRTAVDDLSFAVHAGEVFGLLGPNGAGKTTTVLMLLGLTDPTAGQARVAGLDPTRDPLGVKRRVGYMPDSVGFYDNLTGRANLEYTARLNRVPRAAAGPRIDALLEQVGLADVGDRKVGTYSRGMRQRLGVADALVKDPAVLILDEPTVSLDPEGVAELLVLIRRIAAERGIAILLSSHLLDQVQAVCHRVGIFYAGRLIASGTLDELALLAGHADGESDDEILEVAADGRDPDAVAAILSGLPAVREVNPDPERPIGWLARIERGQVGQVAAALLGAGVAPTHFVRRNDGLDTIYRRLVHGAADAAGDAAATGSWIDTDIDSDWEGETDWESNAEPGSEPDADSGYADGDSESDADPNPDADRGSGSEPGTSGGRDLA